MVIATSADETATVTARNYNNYCYYCVTLPLSSSSIYEQKVNGETQIKIYS